MLIMVANKPSTGESAEQAVPTIACGTPNVFGVFVVTTLACFLTFAREAADALRIRRSARPHRALKDEKKFRRARASKNRAAFA